MTSLAFFQTQMTYLQLIRRGRRQVPPLGGGRYLFVAKVPSWCSTARATRWPAARIEAFRGIPGHTRAGADSEVAGFAVEQAAQ